jgi:hypothetical protein
VAGEGRVGWTGGVSQRCSEERAATESGRWVEAAICRRPWEVGGGGGWGGVLLQMERRVGVEDRVVLVYFSTEGHGGKANG